MYHLIVVGNSEAYDSRHIILERSRVFQEYTNDALRERYSELSEDTIKELKRLPALFAHERGNRKDARLGWITGIQTRPHEIRFSYEFEDSFPAIPWEQIDALEWDLDIGSFEMNRTHWALKDTDLFLILVENGLLPGEALSTGPSNSPLNHYARTTHAPIDAAPSVFRRPTEPRDEHLISVMMPFSPNFDSVYAAISKVCQDSNLRCQRADEIFNESELIQDVFSLIYRSRVVVCDFTTRNPNVYYETGIAHTLGRPVVPLTQADEHVTFDLQHHRFIRYTSNTEGLEELKPKLKRRLQTLCRLSVP